jgi:hypothetical protein
MWIKTLDTTIIIPELCCARKHFSEPTDTKNLPSTHALIRKKGKEKQSKELRRDKGNFHHENVY